MSTNAINPALLKSLESVGSLDRVDTSPRVSDRVTGKPSGSSDYRAEHSVGVDFTPPVARNRGPFGRSLASYKAELLAGNPGRAFAAPKADPLSGLKPNPFLDIMPYRPSLAHKGPFMDAGSYRPDLKPPKGSAAMLLGARSLFS